MPSVVATTNPAKQTGSAPVFTLSATTSSGSDLIIGVDSDDSDNGPVTAVSTSPDNSTFTSQTFSSAVGVSADADILLVASVPSGTKYVKLTMTATGATVAGFIEASGLGGTVDKTVLVNHLATGFSTGAWSSGATATTTAASELVVGFMVAYNNGGGSLSLTGPSSPWTNLTAGSPATGEADILGYQIVSSTGTFTYSGTSSGVSGSNLAYTAMVATFQSGATTHNASASQTITLTQTAAAPLTVFTAALPDAVVGFDYSATLAGANGAGDFTWSVQSGSLPDWASLDASTGVISGTADSEGTGTASFTIAVTDGSGATATQTFTPTQTAAASVSGGGVSQPSGPSGTWTLAWNDEFDDSEGMSGETNGLALSKWNVGWFEGPTSPGGTGYDGTSYTASSGGGAVEFYGPGALAFPSGGGMEMSTYASGDGPDGASFSSGGHSSTTESGGVNTAGIMVFTPNTGYSVPGDIESTVIQAANIVIEVECQFAGPNDPAGAGEANGYWQYIGLYNCGDCSTPDYPNSGTWTEEIDLWEEVGGQGSTGANFFLTFHQASSYSSVQSTPSSLSDTDLSLAMHKYTVQFTDTTIQMWVDGTEVTGISPTTTEVSDQWATPMYFNMQFQVFSGATATGASEDDETATPWKVSYVRVFTQS